MLRSQADHQQIVPQREEQKRRIQHAENDQSPSPEVRQNRIEVPNKAMHPLRVAR